MRERIESLRSQVMRRAELKKCIPQLQAQEEALKKELFTLKIDAHNQQADVDSLNMFSIKNLYYDLTGKKDALLEKETSEARSAKEKYDTVLFQSEQIKRQLEAGLNKEISGLYFKLEGLPLSPEMLPHQADIHSVPENHLMEITSKHTAETRLLEAATAVKNADQQLKALILHVEQMLA